MLTDLKTTFINVDLMQYDFTFLGVEDWVSGNTWQKPMGVTVNPYRSIDFWGLLLSLMSLTYTPDFETVR